MVGRFCGRGYSGSLWENGHINMCLILNDYRRRALWIRKYKSIVNGNKEREITERKFYFNFNLKFKWHLYTEITNLVQFTINCSKIPPSSSKHFATLVQRSRVIRLSWSSVASKTRASSWSRVTTFLSYSSLLNQTQKRKSDRVKPGDLGGSLSLSLSVTIQN
jgi:hypothetical protein